MAPELKKKIKKLKGKGRSFPERAASLYRLFPRDKLLRLKASLGKQQQEMQKGINLSDSFSFLFYSGVVFVFFPLLLY